MLTPTKNNEFGSLDSSIFIEHLQRTLHALAGLEDKQRFYSASNRIFVFPEYRN